ncbi:MAG: hypothetical protein QM639_17050 [Rhodocyclaceae bacterium]
MIVLACLFSLLAATALYASARHQRLLARPLPRGTALALAAVFSAVALWAWAGELWPVSAVIAWITGLMLGLVAWPLLLACLKPAPEGKR